MAGLIDSFSLILKNSFNWRLWVHFILVFIVWIVVLAVPVIVMIFIAVGLGFLLISSLVVGAILFVLWMILFLLILLVFGAILNGIFLNISRELLENEKLDFWLALGKTKPRIFTSIKVEIIVGAFFTLIFILCFLPFLFALIGFFSSISSTDLLFLAGMQEVSSFDQASILMKFFSPILGSLLIGVGLCILIYLAFIPFIVIYKQIPFFESHGAINSIKRAIFLARKNYLKNFLFFVVFFVITFAVNLVYNLLISPLKPPMSLDIIIFLTIVIAVPYTTWISLFSYLFDAKIYLLNTENEKTEKKVVPADSNVVASKDFLAETKHVLRKPQLKKQKTRLKTKK